MKMRCVAHGDTPLFSKQAVGFEGIYSVTFDGRVYSHSRVDSKGNRRNGKWLKPIISNCGYLRIHTCVNAERKKIMIHRIVAFAFIENTRMLDEINHIDGNKKNNSMSNLEWCTPSENFIHALRTGLVENIRDKSTGRFVRH